MKKFLMPLVAITAVVTGTAFEIRSDNGRAGYTGAPGELVCNDCHSTFGASNSGPGTLYVTSTMNNWQYVPGQTYTVNVVVKQTGRPLFGVGFEALTSSNNNAGALVITNAVKTQIKTKSVNGVTRNNVVHNLNGGLSADSSVFSFNWTAPATNLGNITFYFAGVAANNNGDEFQDYVYNSSKLVTPASATGISELQEQGTFRVFCSSDRKIMLQFPAAAAGEPLVELFDLSGHLLAKRRFETSAGSTALSMDCPDELSGGVYLVTLRTGGAVYAGKIMISY